MSPRTALLSLVCLATLGSASAQAQDPGVYRPGSGITNPVLVKKVEPKYTAEALRKRIEGDVSVEAVVSADGTVAEARVVRSLDTAFGLDNEAVEAARQWVFKPGTLNGKAVPVLVTIQVEFRVHGGPLRSDPQPIQSDDEFLKGAYRPGSDVTNPVVKTRVEAHYTSAALREKIQGEVVVEAIVGTDGLVSRARVQKSLDTVYGLDDEALTAAKQWTFGPGTVQGNAVPVVVLLVLDFRVH